MDYAEATLEKRRDLYRADCLWLAIGLLKQDLVLGHTKHEAGIERAHWLLDKYESELFALLAKHDLNPQDYGYPRRSKWLTSTQGEGYQEQRQ